MGFVFESGNPGLAAAARGAAEGFETARRVQDQQQAREMAMTEMKLRQRQADQNFDAFSEKLRHNKAQEARQDLMLAERVEARKADQSLAQQRFDTITARYEGEDEKDRTRAEANASLLRLMGDGSISQKDYQVLMGTLSEHPPEVQVEVLERARGMMATKQAVSSAKALRDQEFSEKFVVGNAATPEEQQSRVDQLLRLRRQYDGDPEGYGRALGEWEDEVLAERGAQEEVGRWVDESAQMIEAGIQNVDEKQEAYMLRTKIRDIGKENPGDPRIERYRDRIDWLVTPKKVREKTMQREKELASAQTALSMLGMTGVKQGHMEQLLATADIQRGVLSELVGAGYAKSEEERGQMIMAGLKGVGMNIERDVLLPVEEAPDQLMEYAFQSMFVAGKAMAGAVGVEVIEAHMNGLMERAGLVADDATRDKYGQWLGDRSILDASKVDEPKIIRANNYKEKERKERRTPEVQAIVDASVSWLDTFKANKEADSETAKVPQGWPPIGIEKQARAMGWRPPMVAEYPTLERREPVKANGSLLRGLQRISEKSGNKRLTDRGWVELDKNGNPKPFWREQTRAEAEAE